MATLKMKMRCQSPSTNSLFRRYDQRPNTAMSHDEFYEAMRLANLGGVRKPVAARIVRRLDPSNSGNIAMNNFTSTFSTGRDFRRTRMYAPLKKELDQTRVKKMPPTVKRTSVVSKKMRQALSQS